jgi:hypothetical protein
VVDTPIMGTFQTAASWPAGSAVKEHSTIVASALRFSTAVTKAARPRYMYNLVIHERLSLTRVGSCTSLLVKI